MSEGGSHTVTAPSRALGHLLRDELEITWRDDEGRQRTTLTEGGVLGSADGVSVQISDRTVSRLHAEITWRDSGPWINDLGSRNGTTVDGVRVDAAALGSRSTVGLGTTKLEVTRATDAQRVLLWPTDSFGPLVGGSSAMRELYVRVSRVAKSEAMTLLVGETGTGKELVARAIHEASPRASGPFVTVDCTALPEALFESELFGHAKGAFTGAVADREGAIEQASGGTLFLDEIGELGPTLQPKLLRALEQRTIRRVGESTHRAVDVRFVAATNKNLAEQVSLGTFREDLYFRLAVIVVDLPPLRARRDDVPMLVDHFLPAEADPLSDDVINWMATHRWPGNVRELRNFVLRSVAMGEDEARAQSRQHVGRTGNELPTPDLDRAFKEVRDEWLAHLEREFVRGWLARKGGNIKSAALAMGLNRTYVHRLIKKHGLDR